MLPRDLYLNRFFAFKSSIHYNILSLKKKVCQSMCQYRANCQYIPVFRQKPAYLNLKKYE